VRDSAGAPIAGAKVRFPGAATAESNILADGSFDLFSLPPGQYKLALVANGKTIMSSTID
jgi:hypothetical protein